MSYQERHETPVKAITERQSFKLELKKKTIEKFIWNKRHDTLTQESKATKFKRKPPKKKKFTGGVCQLST